MSARTAALECDCDGEDIYNEAAAADCSHDCDHDDWDDYDPDAEVQFRRENPKETC